MTAEEAIYCMKAYLPERYGATEGCPKCKYYDNCKSAEAHELAIKALEQEPCEDEYIKVPKKALKYRTAGMVAYNAEWLKNHFDIERAVICGVQEPKTGHWIFDKEKLGYWISTCSECEHIFHGDELLIYKPKYCANCGAKMIEL